MKIIHALGIIAILTITISCAMEEDNLSVSSSDTFSIDTNTIKDSDTNTVIEEIEPFDPCKFTSVSDEEWCSCYPQCCQAQLWFCPPEFGKPTFFKKEVIVDICNNDKVACLYGHEEDCPPPEILYMGECEEAYECPPAAQSLDYGWQWCELEDGTVGKQHVTCDKGQLHHSECQPCNPEICDGKDNDCDGLVDEGLDVIPCETQCGPGNAICIDGVETCFGPEPKEEICDYLDNDCDGDVDEFQRNDCNECGPLPTEVCDAFDNDCDGDTDEDLVKSCSTACGTGIEVCMNGMWSGCTAKQPMPEICDGLDNDCNGQVDDGIECLCKVQDVGKLFPCAESPLLCGKGYKTCECLDPLCTEIITTSCYAICYWTTDPPGSDLSCNPLIGMPLLKEECNNFDDNCNQLIDENLFVECYTGPPDTLGIGLCEAGKLVCEEGVWGGNDDQQNFIPNMCMDEVKPQDEICDGIDNDCDGMIDWGKEVPETDILFVVDWSGSMVDEISAVLIALNQFASHYALQDKLQWGLIIGPKDNPPTDYQERLHLISNISPFTDFLADFSSLGNLGMNTGSEMLLDALYLSLQNISAYAPIDLSSVEWNFYVGESVPAKENFNINWRPGANRIIIVFSDEEPQSFLAPGISVQQIIDTGQATPQLKIYTFSTTEYWQWDELAKDCSGKYYTLSNNATEMYNYLMEILDEICMSPTKSP